jgi:hypothetical protein
MFTNIVANSSRVGDDEFVVTATDIIHNTSAIKRGLDMNIIGDFTDSTTETERYLGLLCEITNNILTEQKRMNEKMEFYMKLITGCEGEE